MTYRYYFHVFKELIRADLLIFKQLFKDKCIDIAIWVTITVAIVSYIMPYFGLSQEFGIFQLGGTVASIGLFEVFSTAFDLVSDFENDQYIFYKTMLPIPTWFVFLASVVYYAITFFILSVCMFGLGKIILWNQVDLTQIYYIKLMLALIFASFFYASFSLWIASKAQMRKIGSIWRRIIFPLWFLGGYQFSWIALKKIVPLMSYIVLLNPIMYITESMRAAIQGQNDFINFWLCLLIILIFSVFIFIHGIYKLKRRLDFV